MEILNNIWTALSTPNVIIMKCAKSLFTKEGMKNNIANYLLLFIIMFFYFQ